MAAINSGIRNASRPQNLSLTAKTLVKDIKQRTREGNEVKGVRAARSSIATGRTTGAKIPTGKFKRLKKSTIRKRKATNLHPETTPTKSNQTMTGAMVDSLDYKTSRSTITLGVGRGQQKKLRGNIEKGRNFLQLSTNNLKTIAQDIVSYISKAIERDLN